MPLDVEIVTPEASLRSGPATACVARSGLGFFTVLNGHAEMVTDLVPGPVRVSGEDGEVSYLCHGGFLQAHTTNGETTVTVLVGVAEPVAEIDATRAAVAKERAQAVLAESDLTDGVRRSAEGALARAELRLAYASAR